MRVLITGTGGREHALAWKLSQSPKLEQLFVAPGNAATATFASNVPIAATDASGLARYATTHDIDLIVIGPEESIEAGVADACEQAGVPCFGPTARAGMLEISKTFCRELCDAAGVPGPRSRAFESPASAIRFVEESGLPWVVKVDGLAAGKGVIVPSTTQETVSSIEKLAERFPSMPLLLEEKLTGQELSFFALTDGETILPLRFARDYKRLLDEDAGPNTGGMGAFCPADELSPSAIDETVERFIRPVVQELASRNLRYRGVLFAGLMVTSAGTKLLEFNCRFGDPETQAMMNLLDGDLLDLLWRTATSRLAGASVQWRTGYSVCVVAANPAYPQPTSSVVSVPAFRKADAGRIFHCSTTQGADGTVHGGGGRVLCGVGWGGTLAGAAEEAYGALGEHRVEGLQFRTDIGRGNQAR